MLNKELISPEGLRIDGRRANEIRRIQCKIGILSHADGSAYLEQGNTKVICAVFGPREVESKNSPSQDHAIINCECSMSPYSTGERYKKGKNSRRTMEISLIIKQTFENVVLTNLFPKTQIDIYVQVIHADGGTRCISINAVTLAMINAGIPVKDFAIGCNIGYYCNTPIMDLNYLENSLGSPDMHLVILPRTDSIVTLQLDSRFVMSALAQTMETAIRACHMINEILQKYVRSYYSQIADMRNC